MVYQNWQIWGILLGLVVPLAMFTLQNGPDETFQNGPNETFRNGPDELISMISEIGHCLLTCVPPYSTCHYLHPKWYSFTGLRVATAPCGLADTKSHEEKRWRDDSTLRQTCTTGKIYFLRFRKIKESGLIMIQIWPICVAYKSSYWWESFLREIIFQLLFQSR